MPPKTPAVTPFNFTVVTVESLNDLVLPAIRQTIAEGMADAIAKCVAAIEPIAIGDRNLRLKETEAIAGISRWAIADLERAGKFPKSVAITDTVFGYRGSEVIAWRDALPRTRPG